MKRLFRRETTHQPDPEGTYDHHGYRVIDHLSNGSSRFLFSQPRARVFESMSMWHMLLYRCHLTTRRLEKSCFEEENAFAFHVGFSIIRL